MLPSGRRRNLIEFVKDRPGHDYRYAIDASLLRQTFDWRPSFDLTSGLRATVEWYLDNEAWWLPLVEDGDALVRLGVSERFREHTDLGS